MNGRNDRHILGLGQQLHNEIIGYLYMQPDADFCVRFQYGFLGRVKWEGLDITAADRIERQHHFFGRDISRAKMPKQS